MKKNIYFFKKNDIMSLISKGLFLENRPVSFCRSVPFIKWHPPVWNLEYFKKGECHNG